MQLTLALPGLLAHPFATLATIDTLSQLAAHASVVLKPDLDTALLHALGTDTAIAPLAAWGAGVEVAQRWVMRADPVMMTAGQDEVRLDGRVDDLDADEAATLHRLLSTHFASDQLVFEAPRPDTWFVLSSRPFTVATTPVGAAIGHSLRKLLPAGLDAPLWRRWFTEIQMLLHEHPLSQRTPHPVNAVWFSEGGMMPACEVAAPRVFAAATRDADAIRGLALLAGGTIEPLAPLSTLIASASSRDRLVAVLDRSRVGNDLDAIRDQLAAAWQSLQRGTLDELSLVADDGAGRAATWQVSRPTWLQRLRRGRARFAMPAEADAA